MKGTKREADLIFKVGVTAVAISMAGVFVTGALSSDPAPKRGHQGIEVQCPSEDSCQPVFNGGHWKIVEVTP